MFGTELHAALLRSINATPNGCEMKEICLAKECELNKTNYESYVKNRPRVLKIEKSQLTVRQFDRLVERASGMKLDEFIAKHRKREGEPVEA